MAKKIGQITEQMIKALNIPSLRPGPVFLDDDHYEHMSSEHEYEFGQYGAKIEEIIQSPSHIGFNPCNPSLELIKHYPSRGEYVKIPVKQSASGNYWMKTMYTLGQGQVEDYASSGRLINLYTSHETEDE